MSIWISSPDFYVAALIGAVMILSASLAQASAFRIEPEPVVGETRLPVLEDSVVIDAPSGYCIDNLATFSTRHAAFVLMASCRSVTGDLRAGVPDTPGLLTASVDGRASRFPSQADLARFFSSPNGRAALSRTGNPDAMELGAVFSRDGVLYLEASEAGGDPAMGARSWRAVFELNGRMVTATLRELSGNPIQDDAGFRTIEALVARIHAASPSQEDIAREN